MLIYAASKLVSITSWQSQDFFVSFQMLNIFLSIKLFFFLLSSISYS